MPYTATTIDSSPVYCTKQELLILKGAETLTISANEQALMESIIEGVSRGIEIDCRRTFFKEDGAKKKYTGNGLKTLFINDFRSIEAVSVDGYALTEGTDFAIVSSVSGLGFPFTSIYKLSGVWESEFEGIEITGDWGWEYVPKEIHLATLHRSKEALDLRSHDSTLSSVTTGDYKIALSDPIKIREREKLQIAKYIRPIWRTF